MTETKEKKRTEKKESDKGQKREGESKIHLKMNKTTKIRKQCMCEYSINSTQTILSKIIFLYEPICVGHICKKAHTVGTTNITITIEMFSLH